MQKFINIFYFSIDKYIFYSTIGNNSKQIFEYGTKRIRNKT